MLASHSAMFLLLLPIEREGVRGVDRVVESVKTFAFFLFVFIYESQMSRPEKLIYLMN